MFRGQVILVTGCSSGIGLATAREAARRGHRVFASARNPADVESLATLQGVRALALDVTEPGAPARAVSQVIAAAGRLDAVVNNAGFGQYGAVEEVSQEEWRRQYDVNLFGALALIQAALPAMREARHGTIVNVSSVAGKLPIPFAAPYCSSKHALEAISDALRVEVAPFGVRVVVVEPGPIETRFGERARQAVSRFLSRPGPYSPFYQRAERSMDSDFQRGRLPPEAVARVIVGSIEAEKPRIRYAVTSMARLAIPSRKLLPDRFFDWQFRRMLKMPKRP